MRGHHIWEGNDAATWRKLLDVPDAHLYDTIGSTNDVARELAEDGAPALTIVVADQQTSGRGRGGRSWISKPGTSLLCSIVLRVDQTSNAAPGTAPVRIGHAVAAAIAEVAGVDARVKWPNDVVIPGHGKVAGVLCEAVIRQGNAFVIAGIGVNVHAPGGDYASLNEVSANSVTRAALLTAVVDAIRRFAHSVTAPLSEQELARIRERDILLGQAVEDESGFSGVARGVSADGSLLVETGSQTVPIHNATIRLAGTHDYPGARV